MNDYADFKQRVIEEMPRLKAMSLKERSSESLVFGISATLEYRDDYTDFPTIIREIDKIKKYCNDSDSELRQFLSSQENAKYFHGDRTNYLYRDWCNACNNVTKVYSEWYKNNTAEIYATLQSKDSDKERRMVRTIPDSISYNKIRKFRERNTRRKRIKRRKPLRDGSQIFILRRVKHYNMRV